MESYIASKKYDIIEKIKKIIRENENIMYDKLIIKIKVNPPYLSIDKAKEYVSDLVVDEQIVVKENGAVECLQ